MLLERKNSQSRTPICDFVERYEQEKTVRLHMPGHKGKGFIGCEGRDITEIDGADVLYFGNGIIKQSEENAARLFNTARTLYSCEGSSLCIRAMLLMISAYALSKGEKPLVLAARNAHKVFSSAAALLDIEVKWLYPKQNTGLVSCKITCDDVREAIKKGRKPTAVFITSPDYIGNIADVRGIAKVCKTEDVLLAVDNAHGAYLNFCNENLHPITLGADICCDSAHKTLSALTGAAYLHISRGAPTELTDSANFAMSVFASTSPSYLILQSLDGLNPYLETEYKQKLSAVIENAEKLKIDLLKCGYELVGDEPLKVTLAPKSYGYTGEELAQYLKSLGIVCEFYDPDFVVLMVSDGTDKKDTEKALAALTKLKKKKPVLTKQPDMTEPVQVMSSKAALFSLHEECKISECEGRVCAIPSVSCPPAVPIVVSGEKIDKSCIEAFEYYGIKSCSVVKD